MKKVFLSLAVLASVALVSCGDKKAENADTMTVTETDTTTMTVQTPAVDCPNQPAAQAEQVVTETTTETTVAETGKDDTKADKKKSGKKSSRKADSVSVIEVVVSDTI